VGAGAGGDQAPPLARGGVGAQDDHRRALELRVGADLAQQVLAGDVGKVQVGEDQVGTLLARRRQARPPLHGGEEPDRRALQEQPLHEAQVRGIVLDVEHGARVAQARDPDHVRDRALRRIEIAVGQGHGAVRLNTRDIGGRSGPRSEKGAAISP